MPQSYQILTEDEAETVEPVNLGTADSTVGALSVDVAMGGVLVGLRSGEIRLVSVDTGVDLGTMTGHRGPVTQIAVDPVGQLNASASFDGRIILWDRRSWQPVGTLDGHQGPVTSIAFSHDGSRLISGGFDRTVKIWDVSGRTVIRSLPAHSWIVASVAVSPDGALIASASRDGSARLWRSDTGGLRADLKGHGWSVSSIGFAMGGTRVVTGCWDGSIRIWDVSGECLGTIANERKRVVAIVVSPDGRHATAVLDSQELALVDCETCGLRRVIPFVGEGVTAITALTAGVGCVVATGDRRLDLWNLGGLESARPEKHDGDVSCFDLIPGGRYVVSGSYDMSLRIWDCNTRSAVSRLPLGPNAIMMQDIAVIDDGRRAVQAGIDPAKVWDLETGTLAGALSMKASPNEMESGMSAVTSVNGATVYGSTSQGNLCLWDVRSGQLIKKLNSGRSGISQLIVTADGKYAVQAAGSEKPALVIWDIDAGVAIHEIPTAGEFVIDIARVGSGFRFLTSQRDRQPRLWDTQSGTVVREFENVTGRISHIAVTPDGTRAMLVQSSRIDVLDLESGRILCSVNVVGDSVTSCIFPRLDLFMTGGDDGSVRFYRVAVKD